MTATITALRGDRTRALVQRPHRKAHVASIGVGEPAWIAMCGRLIPADGASFWIADASTIGDEHGEQVCRDCAAIAELVAWVVDRALAGTASSVRIAR